MGVLEVLDPGFGRPVGQGDLALLGLFAEQAAIALELVRNARQAQDALGGVEGSASSAARLAALVGERATRRPGRTSSTRLRRPRLRA